MREFERERYASCGASNMTTTIQEQLVRNSKTTTKKELIERIASQTQQSRADVKRTVQAFLDHVIDELGQGNRLEFRDFGVFEIRERAARVAQNPKTLEPVDVPPRKTVKFKSGRLMKHSVEGNSDTDAEETSQEA